MKLMRNVYFYEGDFVDSTRKGYFNHYQGMASSNYLVITGKEQVMIDSGMYFGPHKKRNELEWEKDKIDPMKTKHILFSHSHPDHILLAKKLSLNSDLHIQYLMHKDNERLVINEDFFFEAFFNFPRQIKKEILVLPKWLIKAYLRSIGMSFDYLGIDKFFKGNDVINFGTKIEIIELFSHCKGHVGFYFPHEKIFYSGDLFDVRCTHGVDLLVSDSSYEFALQDIERAEALDVEILIPGHGPAIFGKSNIKKTLEKVKRGTKNYIKDIMKYLPGKGHPGITLSELTNLIFIDTIAYNAFSRRIITYNCLDYLLKAGKVKFKVQKNKYHWFSV